MVIEGIPLFMIEFAIGQRLRKTALLAWKEIHPALFGIGLSCLAVSFMLCIYYVIVLSWCVYYFFMSFQKSLPWDKKNCVNYKPYQSLKNQISVLEKMNKSLPDVSQNLTSLKSMLNSFPDCCVKDAPMWYFYHRTLQVSSNIEDAGVGLNSKLVVCLVVAWVVTYLCVVKGIQSSGKVCSLVTYTVMFRFFYLVNNFNNVWFIFYKIKLRRVFQ